jgi:hypothetical protein
MIRNDNVRTEYSKLGVRMTVTIVSRWLLRVTRVYFRVAVVVVVVVGPLLCCRPIRGSYTSIRSLQSL